MFWYRSQTLSVLDECNVIHVFLEKEFLSKEVSGRKVELDEVTVHALLLESSSSQKSVPVTTTPIK